MGQTRVKGGLMASVRAGFKAKGARVVAATALLIGIGALTVFTAPQKSYADPFAACGTEGILFQYPNGTDTQVHLIDMVTGDDSFNTNPVTIDGRTINAIGYNVVDNFIYGWDNTADSLVRVHADFTTVDELTIVDGPGGSFPGTTGNIIIGDVDENGHFWLIDGNANGHPYYQVDVSGGGATLLSQGTISGVPAGASAGADWVYVPGGDGLYRVMHNTVEDQGQLIVFERGTGTFSTVGPNNGLIDQSQLPSNDLKEGAFYADADGFMYASDNDTGDMYRINIQDVTASLFANGPASGSNDGARCADAHIPIDFGDAPDSYGTLVESDGARHGVAEYDAANHTAPLMLGQKIDIETDGFPGSLANGDDLNNIDDEESVTHIVATPGTPTSLRVPVTVTNNTADEATLAGWVDLDGNGTFDSGERVTQSIPANSGTAQYELTFPETTFTDDSYARFRVYEGAVADPQPTGSVAGGEVEDFLVQVGTYEVVKSSDPADGTSVSPGEKVTYTLEITNTGLTDLIGLTLHDDLSKVLDDATLVGNPQVSPSSAGTAVVDHDALQFAFTGDILVGQTVTITYEVEVNDVNNLGDSSLQNMVVAVHSNCHPELDGQTVFVVDENCTTSHPVVVDDGNGAGTDSATLAPTGNGATAVIAAVGALGAGASLLFGRRVIGTVFKAR